MAILSHITIQKLKEAIGSEKIEVLTKLPGIGKKTAQRLIIELKDKMPAELTDTIESIDEGSIKTNDLLQALVSLGYQPLEVKRIIPQLLKDNPNKDEAFLIKKALQILARI